MDVGGDLLKTPGIFHFIVQAIEESPVTNHQGQVIDGAAFRAECVVIGGTVDGMKNRIYRELFFEPKPQDTEDQQVRARLKIDRFLLASSLIKESDKDKDVEIDLQHAVGRQVVMKLELKSDGKNLTAWQDIYHVDDPAIAHAMKAEDSVKALALITNPDLRLIGGRPPVAPTPKPAAPKVDPAAI